jgi:hypothetical protein
LLRGLISPGETISTPKPSIHEILRSKVDPAVFEAVQIKLGIDIDLLCGANIMNLNVYRKVKVVDD